MIYLYLTAGLIALTALLILMTRTVVWISYLDKQFRARLTILGFGAEYNLTTKEFSLLARRLRKTFRKSAKPDSVSAKTERPRKRKKIKPQRPNLGWPVRVQVIKAFALLIGRILSGLDYDLGRVAIQPKLANPALAGMVFGWGQALAGTFAWARSSILIAPVFGNQAAGYSGELTVSIRNSKVCRALILFLRDLPIQKIVKTKYLRRGTHV